MARVLVRTGFLPILAVAGGGGCTRYTYILSDQNFPPCLPCSNGECLKIVRVENGSLSEIASCFLEIMRGNGVPAGSVILLSSVSHLQMRGVAGYMADLGAELARVGNSFRGGWCLCLGFPFSLEVVRIKPLSELLSRLADGSLTLDHHTFRKA